MPVHIIDALVVGAGFGGIYQLKRLRDQGLNAKVIDAASDVGGTWYWNRYPGAMSDTEAYLYRYSWDLEDLKSYPWSRHYVQQAEVLQYLRHVTKRYDLRKDMFFETELQSAQWDESQGRWIVETSTGNVFKARYFVTALGLLSKQNFPDIPGINNFKGQKVHTGNWPADIDLRGKRVGIIGNGSTGVQVITAIAKDVKQLVSFQRNPQFSVPSGDGPVSSEYREKINENYIKIWDKAKNESLFAFGFQESSVPTFSVSAEEREKTFEEAWQKGGGFRFMFWTFGDISVDEKANDAAADFIRRKIKTIVKDPEKVRKLMPTQLYARRPLCDGGYYEQFNRDNVDIVSLKENPIREITSKGIRAGDKEHELDIIIFATGFDAVDGNYTRLMIKGRNGTTLKDHWSSIGPTTYLGVSVPEFPNMFMITGPNGPFSNIPPAIETHVEFISDLIKTAEEQKKQSDHRIMNSKNGTNGYHENADTQNPLIEATTECEREWTQICDELSSGSLFRKTDSWIFGANVKDKKHAVLFYFGGLASYRQRLREIVAHNYKGYVIRV